MDGLPPPTNSWKDDNPLSLCLPPLSPTKTVHLRDHLKVLIETASENWTYAIFWRCSYDHSRSSLVLNFDDGYYKATPLKSEQNLRNKQVRIFGAVMDGEVTDAEWFFKISMAQSFVNDGDLPGHAFFFGSGPVWVTGADQLSGSAWERAKSGHQFGLRTLVCMRSVDGVLELGSTEVISEDSEWTNMVTVFLDRIGSRNSQLDKSYTGPILKQIRLSLNAESFPERADNEIQNRGHNNLYKRVSGKEKIRDSKCSWPLLTESSDKGSDRRSYSYSYSCSNDYSGPSRIYSFGV